MAACHEKNVVFTGWLEPVQFLWAVIIPYPNRHRWSTNRGRPHLGNGRGEAVSDNEELIHILILMCLTCKRKINESQDRIELIRLYRIDDDSDVGYFHVYLKQKSTPRLKRASSWICLRMNEHDLTSAD